MNIQNQDFANTTSLTAIAREIATLQAECDETDEVNLYSALQQLRMAATYLPAKSMDDARFQLKLIAFYVLVDGDTEELFEAIGRLEESVSAFLWPDAIAA